MKCILTCSILFFTTVFLGQSNNKAEPAVFIDSMLVASNSIQYFDSNEIKSVNVIKKDTLIDKYLLS